MCQIWHKRSSCCQISSKFSRTFLQVVNFIIKWQCQILLTYVSFQHMVVVNIEQRLPATQYSSVIYIIRLYKSAVNLYLHKVFYLNMFWYHKAFIKRSCLSKKWNSPRLPVQQRLFHPGGRQVWLWDSNFREHEF